MLVFRPPGHYDYLDPGLVHTDFGFATAAYHIADDATIYAGLIFKEEGLADIAARALDIFYTVEVEYRALNIALAVYQAISERLPYNEFTWSVEGIEDIIASWGDRTPVQRAKAPPEEREAAPEKLRRMPPEKDSPEIVPFLPARRPPTPVTPEEEVPLDLEEEPVTEEEGPPILFPEIPRPEFAPPDIVRPPPARPVPRVGVPVEREIPPVEVPPIVGPPVEEPIEVPGEPEAVEPGVDYGEIRNIAYGAVDRLLEGLRAGDVKVDLVTEPVTELTEEDMMDSYLRQGDLLERAVRKYMQERAEIPAGDTEPPTRSL